MVDAENPNELYYIHGLNGNGIFTGEAYYDIDDTPVKIFLIENMNHPESLPYFQLAFGKRPTEELFYIGDDPYTIRNLSAKEVLKN